MNSDGIDDLLIGSYTGRKAYLVYGRTGVAALSGGRDLAAADIVFRGVVPSNDSGRSISNAGDVNGDGIDDILIGAPDINEAYLIYGNKNKTVLSARSNLTNADVTFRMDSSHVRAGASVSNAGDINGDGIDDLLIGSGLAGSTSLVYGRSGADALSGVFDLGNADVTFTGINGGGLSGRSISNAGDVNGDGVDDLLIGVYNPDPFGSIGAGESYLIYGRTGEAALSGTVSLANADVTFTSLENSSHAVSSAGDINGDGIDDLLVGAYRVNKTYLIYGKRGSDALSGSFDLLDADATFTGNRDKPFTGWSVSKAGDINGDGFDDLLIGGGNVFSDNPEAYLIYGNTMTTGLPVADFTSEGKRVNPGALVQFEDLTEGWSLSWDWLFGTGEGGTTSNIASHRYNNTGLFDVSLAVTNYLGDDSVTKSGYIEVVDRSVAGFDFTLEPLHPGKRIQLFDTSGGVVESWLWQVFDAKTFALVGSSTEQNPLFTFANTGRFHVQLQIDNTLLGNGSDRRFVTNAITVTAVPEPASLALLGLGGLFVAAKKRRKNHKIQNNN